MVQSLTFPHSTGCLEVYFTGLLLKLPLFFLPRILFPLGLNSNEAELLCACLYLTWRVFLDVQPTAYPRPDGTHDLVDLTGTRRNHSRVTQAYRKW